MICNAYYKKKYTDESLTKWYIVYTFLTKFSFSFRISFSQCIRNSKSCALKSDFHYLLNRTYSYYQNHLLTRYICTVTEVLPLPTLKCKGKGIVVHVSFFNWAPRHEGVLEEWRYSSTHSLASALDGGEWSTSRPSRFTARERAPGTHWIGGWVGPRAGLDTVVKRKIPSPLPKKCFQ
jgi:hypothetical protein